MNRAMFSVFLSVFVHFLLMWLIAFAPIVPPPVRDTVQIEILDPDQQLSQNKTAKQIVREAVVPEKEKAKDSEDPLRFWSNQTQRVRKQTRAANIGQTQNRDNNSAERSETQNEKANVALENELANGDLMVQAQEDARRRIPMPTSRGTSTIGESLPQEMDVGSFTALNTDRYLFYSFYSRVEQLIRYRWESGVQRAIDTTARQQLQANVRNRWNTHLEVVLNPHGDLQKVVVMKESGIPAFDRAAISAFAQARYFPNPPREMVEEDGFIRLKYSFTVHFDPRTLAQPY